MNRNVIIFASFFAFYSHKSHGIGLNHLFAFFLAGSSHLNQQLTMQREDYRVAEFPRLLRQAHLHSQKNKFDKAKGILEGILNSPSSFEEEGLWVRLPAIRSLIDDEIESDLIISALEKTLIFSQKSPFQSLTSSFDIAELFLDIGHKKRAQEIFIDILLMQDEQDFQNIWIKLSSIKELIELKESKSSLNLYLETLMIQHKLDQNEQMLAAEVFIELDNTPRAQNIIETLLGNQDKVNLDWIYFQSPAIIQLIKQTPGLIDLVEKVLKSNLNHWATDEEDEMSITDILDDLKN